MSITVPSQVPSAVWSLFYLSLSENLLNRNRLIKKNSLFHNNVHSQVPSAVWSPFYLSLRENLVNRNGLLNFFHDHLRQAVQHKYLPAEADRKAGYKALAQFFQDMPLNNRKVAV